MAPSSSARAGRGPTTGYVDVQLHASKKDEDADDDAMANSFKALDGLSADDFADDDFSEDITITLNALEVSLAAGEAQSLYDPERLKQALP